MQLLQRSCTKISRKGRRPPYPNEIRVGKSHLTQQVSQLLRITPLVVTNLSQEEMEESKVPGSALEAWIGAIYMDRGYAMAKQFVGQKMINPYVDWSVVESKTRTTKSVVTKG